MSVRNKLRDWYRQCISLKGEPRGLAAGFALGIFVGVTPTIPFHTGIIVVLGTLLRQNITAAYLASWFISNPVTIPLLYVSEYEIGRRLLGLPSAWPSLEAYSLPAIVALGSKVLLPLLMGGLLLAPLFACPGYIIALRFFARIRRRQAE